MKLILHVQRTSKVRRTLLILLFQHPYVVKVDRKKNIKAIAAGNESLIHLLEVDQDQVGFALRIGIKNNFGGERQIRLVE